MLKEIADTLGVPISHFFPSLEPASDPSDDHLRAETLDLIRFYYAMPEQARSRFLEVVKAAARGTYGRKAAG